MVCSSRRGSSRYGMRPERPVSGCARRTAGLDAVAGSWRKRSGRREQSWWNGSERKVFSARTSRGPSSRPSLSRRVTRSRISFGSRWNVPTSHRSTIGNRMVAENAPWSAGGRRSTGGPSRSAASAPPGRSGAAVPPCARRTSRRKPAGEVTASGGKATHHAIMVVALKSVRMAEFDPQFAA